MAEVLLITGFWAPNVPFEVGDLYTVIDLLNKRNKTYV